MIQDQIDTAINTEIIKYGNNPNGTLVAYQGLYPGECLSLVKQVWGDILNIQMPASGNGYGDGYYSNFPNPLPTYFNKIVYEPGTNYPKGSMVIYAATHHIAIWLIDNGDGTHNVYEQNADPDGSAPHISSRANTRVTGILTPKEEEMSTWTNGDTYNLLFHAVSPAVAQKAQAANYMGYFGAQNGQESESAFNEIISSPQFDELVAASKGSVNATVLSPGTYQVQ